MPVINAIEAEYATCDVILPDRTILGRYKWTRKDGYHVVEVRVDNATKTRKAFPPSQVKMYPLTKVVMK